MPVLDALFTILIVALILFVLLLSVATLYFVVALRDLHDAVHEMRGRLHHLAAAVTDFRDQVGTRLGDRTKRSRR